MTTKDKILSCHGNLTCTSTAKTLGVSYAYVYKLWFDNGKYVKPKNPQRNFSNRKVW